LRQTDAVPAFVPAVELNRGFYRDVVAPLVGPAPHSAALIGWGSQVLGYDTDRSTDHGWGPRLTVCTTAADLDTVRAAVDGGLPDEYAGWPVTYGWDAYAPRHHVEVTTVDQWFTSHLGFDPGDDVTTIDWLVTPQQLLLEAVAGAVYHDGTGELTRARSALTRYPDDVWRWMLACQWQRVAQEEPFTGRTAEVDDEIGSRLLAAKHVRLYMELHFLYSRTYWPYSKWFGTAYSQLDGNGALLPCYARALGASEFRDREDALVEIAETFAAIHNCSGLPPVDDPTVRPFHGRPFRVIDAERFVNACLATVTDDWLRAQPLVGAIDQCVETTDVLSYITVARRLRALYSR
jgi:hypothetical protein